MENKQRDKWYFKPSSLVVGFLLVGPFVLPLVWTNPGYSPRKKLVVSLVIIILSCLLLIMAAGSIKTLTDYYQQIGNVSF